MSIIGNTVRGIDHEKRTKKRPYSHPATHVAGECNCVLNHEFVTTKHQRKNEIFLERDIFMRSNSRATLDLSIKPSRNIYSGCGVDVNVDKTTGEKTISLTGSSAVDVIAEPEVYLPTGGFLSVNVDAAKNVLICRQQVNITRIDVHLNWLGGPGGGWNKLNCSFSERGPASLCAVGICENLWTQTGRGFNGRWAKSLGDDYSPYPLPPGMDDHEWLSFYPPGGSFTLYPDTFYYMEAYADVGAQTGWFGKAQDPSWGLFRKSMRGYIATIEEWGGGPWNPEQYNYPDCFLALATRIYTDKSCPTFDQILGDGEATPAQDNAGLLFSIAQE